MSRSQHDGAAVGPTAGLVVVIAGPSGVGKGTVTAAVRRALPGATFSVSVTTRRPREGEREGVEYHFVDDAGFDRMIEEGALVEWASYAGNRYGTPHAPLTLALSEGRVVLLDIEVQGALQVKERMPEALLVFLEPPDPKELERRLRARGTDDEAAIRRRLATATTELAARDRFDVVVVNDDLERCVGRVLAAIAARR
ncbi:MAG: hypothetical protein RLZZ272_441 [Actinomycetota bacterium]